MEQAMVDQLILAVAVSMLMTPIIYQLSERFFSRSKMRAEPVYDEMPDQHNAVLIAGFGRFGQIVGRLLGVIGQPFTALEIDSSQVDVVRRYGNIVHYGDASKLELLRAAGAGSAKLFVLAIDDIEASMKTAETVSRHFPNLKIIARARNRRHEYHLMDLGIKHIFRETLLSSLAMGEQVLTDLGHEESHAHRIVDTFTKRDVRLMHEQHAVHHDEEKVMQSARDTAQELESLLRNDMRGQDDS
jgi:voltage-gated potassium channel Kch